MEYSSSQSNNTCNLEFINKQKDDIYLKALSYYQEQGYSHENVENDNSNIHSDYVIEENVEQEENLSFQQQKETTSLNKIHQKSFTRQVRPKNKTKEEKIKPLIKNEKDNKIKIEKKSIEMIVSNKEKINCYKNINDLIDDILISKNHKEVKENSKNLINHKNITINQTTINKIKNNNFLDFDFDKQENLIKVLECQIEREKEERLKIQLDYQNKLQESNIKKSKILMSKSLNQSKFNNVKSTIPKFNKSKILLRKSKGNYTQKLKSAFNQLVTNQNKIKLIKKMKEMSPFIDNFVDKTVDNKFNLYFNKNIKKSLHHNHSNDNQIEMRNNNQKNQESYISSQKKEEKNVYSSNNQLYHISSNPEEKNKNKINNNLFASNTTNQTNNIKSTSASMNCQFISQNLDNIDIITVNEKELFSLISNLILEDIISEEIIVLNRVDMLTQNKQSIKDKTKLANAYYNNLSELQLLEKEIELKLNKNYNQTVLYKRKPDKKDIFTSTNINVEYNEINIIQKKKRSFSILYIKSLHDHITNYHKEFADYLKINSSYEAFKSSYKNDFYKEVENELLIQLLTEEMNGISDLLENISTRIINEEKEKLGITII